MKLSELIFEAEAHYPEEWGGCEISALCADSRNVSRGALFFLTKPVEAYAREAVLSGAAAIVSENPTIERFPVPVITVPDVSKAFALAALRFCGNPQKKLRLCAVTGTNGKTTVAHMLAAILEEGGYSAAVIGTEGAEFCGETVKTGYTTPPPDILAPLLRKAADEKFDFVIMEASSHSLAQKRLFGLDFELGIFTNLTHDHLDYHKTIDECAAAKALLFAQCENSVINFDDPRSHEMAWAAKDIIRYYSIRECDEDFFADNIEISKDGVSFDFCIPGAKDRITSPLPGMLSVLDMLAAASAGSTLGIRRKLICRALGSFSGVPGRMEKLTSGADFTVIVDFAHTPEAMRNSLLASKTFTEGRLITVFGCGGERDRSKRPEMGNIAASYSDLTVITSDNPRSESPAEIIEEIRKGVPEGAACIVEPDRAGAIRRAINEARPGDTVILLGKGNEEFIELAGERIPFSDRNEALKILKEKGL